MNLITLKCNTRNSLFFISLSIVIKEPDKISLKRSTDSLKIKIHHLGIPMHCNGYYKIINSLKLIQPNRTIRLANQHQKCQPAPYINIMFIAHLLSFFLGMVVGQAIPSKSSKHHLEYHSMHSNSKFAFKADHSSFRLV